jgi:Amt family ammonium transporter
MFGDTKQFVAQVIGVITNVVVVFGVSYLFFRGLERLVGNRVEAEVESEGLDELEMGSEAYTRD